MKSDKLLHGKVWERKRDRALTFVIQSVAIERGEVTAYSNREINGILTFQKTYQEFFVNS